MTTKKLEYYFTTADEAEAAFYSAFEMGDMELMNAVMADENVSCIHPTSIPLIGREEVLNSWKQILNTTSESVITIDVVNRSNANGVAIHVVSEIFSESHNIDSEFSQTLATNVYVEQKNGWRMMMHHASFASDGEYTDEDFYDGEDDLMNFETSKTIH